VRQSPEAFLRARLAALYLLSLAAVSGSILAWHPERAGSPVSILWPPLGLAAAALAGTLLQERFSGLLDRYARARLRAVAGLMYGCVLLLVGLGLLAGARDAAETGCGILRAFQPVFLILAGFGRGHLGTLINGFALTSTSLLAGGPIAAASTALHGAVAVFFFAADHAARTLSEFPVDEIPPAGPILRRGAVPALLILAALAVFFWKLPAAPYAPLLRSGAAPNFPADKLAGLLANLLGVAIVSTVGFFLLLRYGGGSRGLSAAEPVVVRVPVRRREGGPEGSRFVEPPVSPREWRARIVSLYLRTTEQLAKWGRRRRAFQTPREFSRSLAPAGPAADLAELFDRARYGDLEMSQADFDRATQASREVIDHHRRPA